MIRKGYWAVHTVCGTSGSTVLGVDVSKWQATVDWTKVKAAGIEYAFARISDGTTYPDAYFDSNYKGIKAAGMIRGSYQYFRPSEDPVPQANLVLSKLKAAGGLTAGDLPVVLDLETTGGASASTIVKNMNTWLSMVQQGTGRRPIIYTGSYFWDGSVLSSQHTQYPLWTAHYTSASCPLVPNPWNKWHFWQYTSSGKVNGISGNADMNRFDGTLADLKDFINKSVIQPPDAGVPDKGKPDLPKPPDKGIADKPKAPDKTLFDKPKAPDQGKREAGPKPDLLVHADRGSGSDGPKKPGPDASLPPASFNSLDGGCALGGQAHGPAALLVLLLLLVPVRRRMR